MFAKFIQLNQLSQLSQRARRVFLLSAVALILPLQVSAEGKKNPFSDGPKTIASKEQVSVLIDREITEGKKFIVLKISVPTDSQVKAFTLADPPRVVVDFEGASIKKSEEFQAPDNEVIKTVRLGAHPQKIRVVLDMRRSTPPEYDWKAGKRQAVLKFFEGQAEAPTPDRTPSAAPTRQPVTPNTGGSPAATLPTAAPQATTTPAKSETIAVTVSPTVAQTATPATTPTAIATAIPDTAIPATGIPATPAQKTLSDVEPKIPTQAGANGAAAAVQAAPGVPAKQGATDLGDLEKGASQPKAQSNFLIMGYKFEYLADKTPVLKIILNKPPSEAQISKVDEETYKIEIKDCGLDNEDLELPQFPPHDFVGFVMALAESVGKNTEVSISIEENVVLGTSIHGNEIWVKKP
jgi:hypothetical protein